MKTDILTKFRNKKKMWITPKHPFYFEKKEFKILYGAGIFMHAALNKSVSTLNNFELERLLMKGFGLLNKEIAEVIKTAKEGSQMFGDIADILNEKNKKYMFILDMVTISLSNHTEMSVDEKQSVHLFAQMLEIGIEEENILIDFAKCAYELELDKCIKNFDKMIQDNMQLTMTELKYFVPEIEYVTKIESKIIKSGSVLRLVDNCELKEDIIVPANTTLIIANAIIKMEGSIIIDGGKLIIQDSKLTNYLEGNTSLIIVKNYSEVEMYNSIFECRSMGTVLNQQNGNLMMKDCKVFNTSKDSAIRFWGNQINMERITFNHCFSIGNGAAITIKQGRGLINNCDFSNCEAKNGGAIYTFDEIMIQNCKFKACRVVSLGAAIYYNGEIKLNIINCEYNSCIPENEEIIQHIYGPLNEKNISKEYDIHVATVLDSKIHITQMGILNISDTVIYLNQSIICDGTLNIKNSKIVSLLLKERDMFILNQARGVKVENSEFDGRKNSGAFMVSGTRVVIKNSIFRNTAFGRSIYDAFEPIIEDTVFTYCGGGAIYCCSGKIMNCTFINCRDKSAAGISMYGARGIISECKFIHCISEYSEGVTDLTRGNKRIKCEYEECKEKNA